MKKITLSIIACLSFFIGSAQYEPDATFLQELIWRQIMPHDSVVWSSDSGAAFTPEEIASITLFPDGLIDNLSAYDPNLIYTYDGVKIGILTNVYGIDPSNQDTNSRYDFYKNQIGQDSLIKSYYDDGFGNLEFNIAFEMVYDSTGRATNFFVFADIFGSGALTKVNDYKFHYNNNLLDSVTIDELVQGAMRGKLESKFNSSGQLVQFDFYEIDQNDELIPSDRYFFKHNSQGEINEVIELFYDDNNNVYELSASWKYYRRVNSNISTPEESKAIQKKDLVIYPNPAKDEISINSTEKFNEFSIMNLTGQVVKAGKFDQKINVSELGKGIYLISLKSKESTEIRKFQKL